MAHRIPARRLIRALAVLCAVLAVGCGTTSAPSTSAAQTADNAEWTKHVREFENRYFALNPPFAVQQGRHEYDGRLPDWTAGGIRAEAQWLHGQRAQAEKFDQNTLSAAQRFERQYLLS